MAVIDLSTLGAAGTTIFGANAGDQSGYSVSSAGDVNGDGFDDLLIGAYHAAALGNSKATAGESYVIFGRDFTASITNAGTAADETRTGTAAANVMNGSRGNDTLIGSGGADVLIGGQGDDILAVSDLNFNRIVGGNGSDTLTRNYREVLNISDDSNTLNVFARFVLQVRFFALQADPTFAKVQRWDRTRSSCEVFLDGDGWWRDCAWTCLRQQRQHRCQTG